MAIFYPANLEQNSQIVAWARSQIEWETDFGNEAQSLAAVRKKAIVAAIVYYNYRGVDCEIAFAASHPSWATKQTIGIFLLHPFKQFGCKRLTAVVHTKNKRVRKLLEGICFIHEGTLRHAFFPGNAQIYGLTAKDFYASKFYKAIAPEDRGDVEPVAIPENAPRLCLIGANAA